MDLFERALAFALKAHEGQTRKKNDIPYILHPCEAAAIAATLTADREILSAVVLHDTVEDTAVTEDDIRRAFGERIAQLVLCETEEGFPDLPRSASWRLRKESSLEHLASTADIGVKVMWMADKLSNMRSFYQLYLREGDAMWRSFNQQSIPDQEWYYRSIAALLSEFADTPAHREYCTLMNVIFGGKHEN